MNPHDAEIERVCFILNYDTYKVYGTYASGAKALKYFHIDSCIILQAHLLSDATDQLEVKLSEENNIKAGSRSLPIF